MQPSPKASTLSEKTEIPLSLIIVMAPILVGIAVLSGTMQQRQNEMDKRLERLEIHDEQRDQALGEIRRRAERMDVQVQFLYDEARRKKEQK